MISKTVLVIVILLSLDHYQGVQCFKKEIIESYNALRNYDIPGLLNFSIDQFDVHNRQCFLAFLVYTLKSMYTNTITYQLNYDEDVYSFITRLIRLLNIEFTSKFGNEISIFYEVIRDWNSVIYNENKQKAVREKAQLLIKLGIQKYVWNTEKEAEILKEYRTTNKLIALTIKAYKECKTTFQQLAERTKTIEKLLKEEFKDTNANKQPKNYNFKSSELRDFGTLIVFMTITDYKQLSEVEDNVLRNKIIIENLMKILIEMFRVIETVIDKIVYENVKISWGIVIIFKHLYRKTIDITQDLYLLVENHTPDVDDSLLKKEYDEFNRYCQLEWNSFVSEKPILKGNPSYQWTRENSFFDHRLILLGFYRELSDSWVDNYPDDFKLLNSYIPFYEINIMLTVVKHNVYILTAAARNPKKRQPAWDCGYINGCTGPSTGTLGYVLKLKSIPGNKSVNDEFMEIIQKSREFIEDYCTKPAGKSNAKSQDVIHIQIMNTSS